MRIYKVTTAALAPAVAQETEQTFLVDAKSRGAAERHVARKFVTGVEPATTREVAALMEKGLKVETAAEGAEA